MTDQLLQIIRAIPAPKSLIRELVVWEKTLGELVAYLAKVDNENRNLKSQLINRMREIENLKLKLNEND
jgi:hypothetical protein